MEWLCGGLQGSDSFSHNSFRLKILFNHNLNITITYRLLCYISPAAFTEIYSEPKLHAHIYYSTRATRSMLWQPNKEKKLFQTKLFIFLLIAASHYLHSLNHFPYRISYTTDWHIERERNVCKCRETSQWFSTQIFSELNGLVTG